MGHIRLGRLPKTLNWIGVLAQLDNDPFDPATLAARTLAAAEEQLRKTAGDPALSYCFWLLTRISWASRTQDFEAALRTIGISVDAGAPAMALIARVAEQSRTELATLPNRNALSDIAAMSLRKALAESVGVQANGLFGSSIDDVQHAFRQFATDRQFGALSKAFFGHFLSGTLQHFLDRELSNHVGQGQAVANVDDSRRFLASIDGYARQSARIMEDFASGWYSKHNWEAGGQISRDEASRFTAYALRKLRMEIGRESSKS